MYVFVRYVKCLDWSEWCKLFINLLGKRIRTVSLSILVALYESKYQGESLQSFSQSTHWNAPSLILPLPCLLSPAFEFVSTYIVVVDGSTIPTRRDSFCSRWTYVNLSLHAGGIEAALRETTILSTPSLSGSQYQFTFLHSATSWNIGVRCDYILAHCLERYTGFSKCESVVKIRCNDTFLEIFSEFLIISLESIAFNQFARTHIINIHTFTPYFVGTNWFLCFISLFSM